MLTIFSCPKPFRGHFGMIQRNAIRSWTLLKPTPDVILIGDEKEHAMSQKSSRFVTFPTWGEMNLVPLWSVLFLRKPKRLPPGG